MRDFLHLFSILLCIIVEIRCNIWDNIFSNSEAPTIPLFTNGEIIFVQNSSSIIEHKFFIALSGEENKVLFTYSFSIHKDNEIFRGVIDFNAMQIYVKAEEECRSFLIPSNVTIRDISQMAKLWPFLTIYRGKTKDGKYYEFEYSNPLNTTSNGEQIYIYFDATTKEIAKIIIAVNFKPTLTLLVEDVKTVDHFPWDYFSFDIPCKKADKKTSEEFWKIFFQILDYLL